MKIGICFGGYCPLHRGHMDLINKARKTCDYTFVVVCGYDNEPRANSINLPLDIRYKLISDFLTDDVTSVISINDTVLGLDESCSISNWTIWTNAVLEKINTKESRQYFLPEFNDTIHKEDITFFVSEEFYKTSLNTIGFNVELSNRDITNISATAIREHPLKYWQYIAEPFRPYMVTKILVVGTASEGKTTLCKDIAKYYNIPWIPEYGRLYMEEANLSDVDLTLEDFKAFIDGQTKLSLNAVADKAATTGLLISDTDNLITLMYAHAYGVRDDMPNMSVKDSAELEKYARDNIAAIDWDYIIILSPTESFVDDGTRFMGQSSIEERNNNYNYLIDLLDKYYSNNRKIYLLNTGYYNRYSSVCDIINNFYNGKLNKTNY